MQLNNYLRFSLMLGNTQASTFYSNLFKMIELVLFDSYGKPLSTYEVSIIIKDKYDLEFDTTEILNAIERKNNGKTLHLPSQDHFYDKYTISPEEYQKLKQKEQNYSIQKLTQEFMAAVEIEDLNETDIQSIIIKFFYDAFNSNANTILLLLNHSDCAGYVDAIESFTAQEKIIINSFLDWKNNNKDTFVFNAISCCFDYCMLTIKKDNRSFEDIFQGKCFYLDSNIIFRLAGFNKDERKRVMISFVDKCMQVGIHIVYTNITKLEIETTINHHVTLLAQTLDGQKPGRQKPISTKAMAAMNPFGDLDFYDIYISWVQNPVNRAGDYDAFEKYLNRKVDSIVRDFEFATIRLSNSFLENENIKTLSESYKEYKTRRRRKIQPNSIKCDIVNYLYLDKINGNIGQRNFTDVKNYIITADHAYSSWAKDVTPCTVPVVVLPSVWYSIILKYTGRSNDDFFAFCKFLNFRINSDVEFVDPRKIKILEIVLELDEPAEIREEIIYDISSKLKNEYNEIVDPEEIVNNSYQYIINKKTEDALQAQRAQHLLDIQQITQESNCSIETSNSISYKNGLEEGQKIEQESTKKEKEISRKLSDSKIKWLYPLYWCIAIIMGLAYVAALMLWILFIMKLPSVSENIKTISPIIVLIFTIVYGILSNLIFKNGLKGLNKTKLKDSIVLKYYHKLGVEISQSDNE